MTHQHLLYMEHNNLINIKYSFITILRCCVGLWMFATAVGPLRESVAWDTVCGGP